MIGLMFGAYNLQDPANGVWVTDTDVYSAPRNTIQAEPLAETDGAFVVKQQLGTKPFTVSGILRAETRADVEALRDTFLIAMSQKNQAFDIEYAGDTRRYLANAQNTAVADKGLTSFAFSVEFLSADGVGWSTDSSELVPATAITTGSASTALTAEGSYQVEPLIVLTVSSVTGGTAKTVQLANGTTLRGLRVTRDWTSGDVLEVDSIKKTVFVNNVATDFLGQFPKWDPGDGSLNYIDDFTTRSVSVTASYTRRWL